MAFRLAVSPPNAKLLPPAPRRHSAATEAATEAAKHHVVGEAVGRRLMAPRSSPSTCGGVRIKLIAALAAGAHTARTEAPASSTTSSSYYCAPGPDPRLSAR
eukprot:scaffold112995_cov48-Phaeocystis_antarctica.AAC.2